MDTQAWAVLVVGLVVITVAFRAGRGLWKRLRKKPVVYYYPACLMCGSRDVERLSAETTTSQSWIPGTRKVDYRFSDGTTATSEEQVSVPMTNYQLHETWRCLKCGSDKVFRTSGSEP